MKNMAIVLFFSVVLSCSRVWAVDAYPVDKVHSSVGFSIAHMMVSKVTGAFDDIEGSLQFDPNDLAGSSFNITIKVASVNTKNVQRDDHLRSADFFDAANMPLITFKTSRIVKQDGNVYIFSGDLTMKGVTKRVEVPVTLMGPVKNPMSGGEIYGLESRFTVSRQDYGVKWNKTLDNGGFLLGNDVEVAVSIAAEKK